jgi:outer membrane receptor protein involved in Fe transport
MENWEFGWKTGWELGGAMQLNGALFFQDYTDKQIGTQILVPDGSGGFRSNPRVINASAAEVWGFELEAIWQPAFMEGLVLQGGYTFLDTQYTDFVDETTTATRAASVGECPVVWKDGADNTIATGTDDDPNLDEDLYPLADREYDVVSGDLFAIYAPKCALNLSGNELERAPQNAFVGNVSLTRPFMDSGMDWYTSLNAVYQDERYIKADNFVKWDDYWLFDFQLGLMSERVDVLFYVENLFDDDTLRSGGEGPDFGPTIQDRGFSAGLVQLNFFGPLPPPRRAGIRLSYRFQ